MQDFNIKDNIMASCGDASTSQFNDSCTSKVTLNVNKQAGVNRNLMPQLQTLTQVRSQPGITQPLVQLSGLQVPQQIFQHQLMKTGQSANVTSFIPSVSLPNIFSALHYQFLLQALQGLNSVSPSCPSSDHGAIYTSATQQAGHKLNTSFSFDDSSVTKINGSLVSCNKDVMMTTRSMSSDHMAWESTALSVEATTNVMKTPVCASIGLANNRKNSKSDESRSEKCQTSYSFSNVQESSPNSGTPVHPIPLSLPTGYATKEDFVTNRSVSQILQERNDSKSEFLTHIIEGHIIQEGPRPFLVERSMYINEFLDSENDSNEMTDDDDADLLDSVVPTELRIKGSDEKKQCHCCGIFFHPKTSVSRTGKFCSVTCSKRTAACSRWMIHYASKGLSNEKNKYKKVSGMSIKKIRNLETYDELSDENETNEGKDSSNIGKSYDAGIHSISHTSLFPECSKISLHSNVESKNSGSRLELLNKSIEKGSSHDLTNSDKTLHCDASLWGVSEVCQFIQTLSGCSSYAEDFKRQEIDGQALLLLTEEHLMSTMNIKLGPALKICSNIRALKSISN